MRMRSPLILGIAPASVGTQIIVAIVVGLLTAFAVQFLLTNLGLALGISLLKYRPQTSAKQATKTSQSDGGKTNVNLGFFAGLGILLTLNSVLFVACFLAVRFSTASDPLSGATLGIVIWSTYFLILIWASYSTVGSVTSWVFGSVATKLHQLIKAIARSLQETEEPVSVLTEEAAKNMIHQEIQAAWGEFDLQQQIDDYLQTIPSPEPNLTAISQGFANFLNQLDLESLAEANLLQKIDRQTFVNLIDERTNLSTPQAEQIADRLESVWQQIQDRYQKSDLNEELLQFLQSADPEELQLERLVKRLEQIADRSEGNSPDSETRSRSGRNAPSPQADLKMDNSSSADKGWSNLNWKAIKNALFQRVDLSDIELEDIWHTLKSLEQQFDLSEIDLDFKLPFNTISNDIEDYLRHAPPWYLNCNRGWQEFKEVIYDPQADPVQVRSQLESVQPEYFVELLQQRDDLDLDKIDEIVKHLEAVRQEVFQLIERAELSLHQQELSELLRDYLQQAEPTELQGDKLLPKLEQLLVESGISLGILTQFLADWQQLDWHTWLQSRKDLAAENLRQIAARLPEAGDRLSEKVETWQVQIDSTAKELQHKLESYLRYTNIDHLTPEKIDAKLEQLCQQAIAPLPQMQQQLLDIDRSTVKKILKKRKGIDLEQLEKITAQIETKWQKFNSLATPDSQLQTKSQELTEKSIDYFYRAIAQNKNISAIEVDLSPLLNLARGKTKTAINRQLAKINWNEIEARLIETRQGSERQIRQTIKQARAVTRKLIKLPRRWATRTSRQAQDLVGELQDFLSHSHKSEFTSKNLKRNLESIFHRSTRQHYNAHNNSTNNIDRQAKLTPADITQSLSYRQDLTSDEIAQISDRFLATTSQFSDKIKTQQEQTDRLFQDLLDRLDKYFSSPNLLHLYLDGLQDSLANFDWQSLTDVWQETISEIPLEELSDRLEQLSSDTLASIVETARLPDSTLEQVKGIPDYIARQVETLKQTAHERTETIKQQSLQQIETTRKAIATAAYWMFAISFTSAVASTLAGYLAAK